MSLEARTDRVRPQEDHWVPLSDLMTGLMMIFRTHPTSAVLCDA